MSYLIDYTGKYTVESVADWEDRGHARVGIIAFPSGELHRSSIIIEGPCSDLAIGEVVSFVMIRTKRVAVHPTTEKDERK